MKPSCCCIWHNQPCCKFPAERERVEGLLAIGATRMEAMKGIVQRSLQDALTPALNQMSVIGIVSLPELLSGQLVAGATPLQVPHLLFEFHQ